MPSPNAPASLNAPTPPALSETASTSSTSTATATEKRRSTRHHCPRYLDNALTGNEVLDMLDEFIIDSDAPQRRKRRRRVPRPPKQTAADQTPAEGQKPIKKKAAAALRPRWYNQVYLIFLALRQSPEYTASRGDLVRRAVELDEKISKERNLPRAFTGRTPLNSASAVLTNNWDKHFVQFRPEGARSYHFKLAYLPGDFESALKEYDAWMQVLVEKDWPVCFGPEIPAPAETSEAGATEASKQDTLVNGDSCDNASAIGTAANIAANNPVTDLPKADIADDATREAEHRSPTSDSSHIEIPTTTSSISDNIPRTWRDIVEVKPSTIPHAGNGLFAARDLPGGIPLGFYFGVPMTEDEYDSLKDTVGMASHYSIMYRKTVLDATDTHGMPYTDPAGRLYCPFHFMNEDREGKKCNIAFLEGVKVNQIICLTTRSIKQGEELFVSYGEEVDRSKWGHDEDTECDEPARPRSMRIPVVDAAKGDSASASNPAIGGLQTRLLPSDAE
ncbi:hypothetical protein FBU59_002848 [Linderina macrospora]|uniref:Uncharacterized protein n=1 Tax=Linderina macrospora TaxID=4868 RepID=A0ACC1JA58_9FUNG|nr:hypothetical protein FBU59_002848 [Linderina macrospora]